MLGPQETEALRPVDGEALKATLPKYVVGSTNRSSWMDEDDEDIFLIDRSEAFAQETKPAKIA